MFISCPKSRAVTNSTNDYYEWYSTNNVTFLIITVSCWFFPFCFVNITSSAQELLLVLHSKHNLGRAKEIMWVARDPTLVAVNKINFLPTVDLPFLFYLEYRCSLNTRCSQSNEILNRKKHIYTPPQHIFLRYIVYVIWTSIKTYNASPELILYRESNFICRHWLDTLRTYINTFSLMHSFKHDNTFAFKFIKIMMLTGRKVVGCCSGNVLIDLLLFLLRTNSLF